MANLPGNRQFVQTQSVVTRAPVSENVMQNISGNINFINESHLFTHVWKINGNYATTATTYSVDNLFTFRNKSNGIGTSVEIVDVVQQQKERDEEIAAKKAAKKAAKEAQETVDKLQRDLEDLDKRVGTAVDAVVAAQTDADRAGAKAKLEKLRAEQAAQQQAIANAKAAADRAKRLGGLHVSQKCLDNPLAKGC